MQHIDQINRELRELGAELSAELESTYRPAWPWPTSPAPLELPEFEAWNSWFQPEPPATSTVTCQLTPTVQPTVDAVQKIRELRDEAARMFVKSSSPGYKLHDLYRMKLDAILAALPEQSEPKACLSTKAQILIGQLLNEHMDRAAASGAISDEMVEIALWLHKPCQQPELYEYRNVPHTCNRCGLGSDAGWGHVCFRNDCPTKVTC